MFDREKWNYVCLFVDLFNRETIGHSAGENKTEKLVYQVLASIQVNLNEVKIFHRDRGKELRITMTQTYIHVE